MTDFAACFGRPPDVVATARGRVNLIGEHTDYNGGFVLPTAISQSTTVAVARRDDDRVRVSSAAFDHGAVREYRLGAEARHGDWVDYVRGCTKFLAPHGALRGFDARVVSTVPVGGGLSSSAALEVSLLRALRAAFAIVVDDVTLAMIAHRAEVALVGARTGVMDQMAACLADERTALFLDAHSLQWQIVPLPTTLGLLVVDSGIAHRNAGGGYAQRRRECETACAQLGVGLLRDLSLADVARSDALPAPLDRRVRHVVTENERVVAAVAALRAGDLPALGRLMRASHASMRDDYAVSLPEIDVLVEIAADDADVYGARLTGGGFGGAIVAAVHAGTANAVGERVVAAYRRQTGCDGRVLVAR